MLLLRTLYSTDTLFLEVLIYFSDYQQNKSPQSKTLRAFENEERSMDIKWILTCYGFISIRHPMLYIY